jgi:hypothetical protein
MVGGQHLWYPGWDTFISGSLDASGGTIRFKHAGVYELVARVTDATGRMFLYEPGDKIKVLPVLTIRFDLRKPLTPTGPSTSEPPETTMCFRLSGR